MNEEVDVICDVAVMFVRSVSILALPADAQIDWLRSFGLGEPGRCDDIVDEFYQHWLLLPRLARAGLIPGGAVECLNELQKLTARLIQPDSEFGSLEALTDSLEWAEVRRVARQCVFKLK